MLIKHKNLTKIHSASNVVHIEPTEAARAVQMELHKAKQEAKAIKQEAEAVLEESRKKLDDAETKAAVIIDSANKQAEAIKQKVYSETLSAAKNEADEMKTQSREILLELFEVKKQTLFQAHSDIIKVALDLAEKIIKYQASVDPNILRTQVIEAIKKATSEADRVQVYVNPQDLKRLEQLINDLEKLFPSGIDIIPLSNDSVELGSCIVETKSGQLDARFSTQLKSLSDLVIKAEVAKPQIDTVNDIQRVSETSEQAPLLIQENELFPSIKEAADVTTGEESSILIDQSSEETIIHEDQQTTEAEIVQPFSSDDDMLEIPKEIVDKVKESKEAEDNSSIQLKKKKIFSDDLTKRTKEEEEELDETIEYEEENNEEENNEEEEDDESKEKKIPTEGILKPKKQQQKSQISDIASELEKNPEWKDLLQNEDEE